MLVINLQLAKHDIVTGDLYFVQSLKGWRLSSARKLTHLRKYARLYSQLHETSYTNWLLAVNGITIYLNTKCLLQIRFHFNESIIYSSNQYIDNGNV